MKIEYDTYYGYLDLVRDMQKDPKADQTKLLAIKQAIKDYEDARDKNKSV